MSKAPMPKIETARFMAVLLLISPLLAACSSDDQENSGVEKPADNAESLFRGPLGDFEIVGVGNANNYCPPDIELQPASVAALESSELYFRSANGSVGGLVCQGVVALVTHGDTGGDYQQSEGRITLPLELASDAIVTRLYFDDKPEINVDAPRDRLELSEVAGRPALLALTSCDLFVIERRPSAQQPGIVLAIHWGCEGLRGLAESLLAEFLPD